MITFRLACGSVGRGWLPLIRTAFKFKPENVRIVQVKEKFGGLRIYFEPHEENYGIVIKTLESISFRTCEWCGRRGKADNSYYWTLTLCKECRKKRKEGKS